MDLQKTTMKAIKIKMMIIEAEDIPNLPMNLMIRLVEILQVGILQVGILMKRIPSPVRIQIANPMKVK